MKGFNRWISFIGWANFPQFENKYSMFMGNGFHGRILDYCSFIIFMEYLDVHTTTTTKSNPNKSHGFIVFVRVGVSLLLSLSTKFTNIFQSNIQRFTAFSTLPLLPITISVLQISFQDFVGYGIRTTNLLSVCSYTYEIQL